MRIKILVPLVVMTLLCGCTSAREDVCLTQSQDELFVEAAVSAFGEAAAAASSMASFELSVDDESGAEASGPGIIAVYVCGAVENAGVYELENGSRIVDAVDAAGGFSAEADRTYVNLAAKATDGMKLQIPTVLEVADSGQTGKIESFEGETDVASSDSQKVKLININTASKDELTGLTGIGDSTAQKIIDYREKNGGFSKIEDIMRISGIKEKLFSKIKDSITV